jgi:membrane protease YdiL (CAAX protease family)
LALIAVSAATLITIRILEPDGWPIGLFTPPANAARELLFGVASAALLIGTCDLVLLVVAHAHHTRRHGLPWLELATVFVPAAFHEELVFRGYLFQKLRSVNRSVAFAFSSFLFAMLHLNNRNITPVALANIALAGIMLALAYERYERLWFPIGIHLSWNILSGPVLGYSVSGYDSQTTVFATTARGADWITGSAFGIEGSVFIAAVEIAAITWLGYHPRRIPSKESSTP